MTSSANATGAVHTRAAPYEDRDAASPAALIRTGVVLLPLGGALKLVGNLGTFNSVGYGIPQPTEAARAATPAFFAGEFAGSLLPVLLAPFAVFALFAYLAPLGRRRTLVAALVCSVVGAGITLPALGVVNYAFPALARAYRAGDRGAMDIVDSFFTWPRGAMLYPAVLVPVGAVLFAAVMWRSRALPKTAVILFALSTVLVAVPVPLHAVRVAGAAPGVLAGAWIAGAIHRDLRRGALPAPAATPRLRS